MNATIFTTAEILLGELESTKLSRIYDQRTGYPELFVPKDQVILEFSQMHSDHMLFASGIG